MHIVYNHLHEKHHGRGELNDGQIMPCFEKPQRVEFIINEIKNRKLGELINPEKFDVSTIEQVHDKGYIEFLQTAWAQWTLEHGDTDALPLIYPGRGLRNIIPEYIDGKVSYYALDAGTPITKTSWTAIQEGANTTISAAKAIQQGMPASFALTRPPGHHAHSDQYGGYCFVNNAAVAAQWLRDQGAARVSIFDVDYHHGNGTQDIFYDRDDVQFLSIHADPKQEFPYFLGYADELGKGRGEGFNFNYPLPWGTQWDKWQDALQQGLKEIDQYSPDALIISLGVDTYFEDPISRFALKSEHFLRMGEQIAKAKIPTLFVMEGGYATEAIGVNVCNVLDGFENAR